MERRGITPSSARTVVRTNTTVIAALMVLRGEADAMLAGAVGSAQGHLKHVTDILGLKPGATNVAGLSALILSRGTIFLCDTHVNPDPTADQIAEMAIQAAAALRRFLIHPKVALVSHSSFGSQSTPSANKMRVALEEILRRAPDLEVEGEMHANAALSEEIRQRLFPNSRLKGEANLLVMPTLDAAHIALNLVRSVADGQSVGPILLGVAKPAHILSQSVSVRGIVNMSALAVVDGQVAAEGVSPA
jgi:malate dehydrogenase (oxaloacetate-decarboxylating)(NADP+)